MVELLKAKVVEGKIELRFKKNQEIESRIAGLGAKYNMFKQCWTVPENMRGEVEIKLGDFLLTWEGESTLFNGGIDESKISPHPTVPGYRVEYDNEGKIIESEGFKLPPYGDFQVKGFNELVDRDFLILGDEMGLGKTMQVLTALEAKIKLGHMKRALILAKATLLYNWRDEVEKFTNCKAVVLTGPPKQRHKMISDLCNDGSWTFLIMSYETYRMTYSNISMIDDYNPIDALVLDEAHKTKNPLSKIGQAIHHIHFKYRYVLTATPLPNSPLEAFNYLKLGSKLPISGMSVVDEWYIFKDRYAVMGGYHDREIVGYKNINELKTLIQDNMLRRLKADKLKDLPDYVIREVKLDMTPAQNKIYNAIRKEILADLAETDLDKVPAMLAKLARLQQVTSSLDTLGVETTKSNNAKLTALQELVEEIMDAGEKLIVFSKFRPTIHMLQDKFKDLNPAVVHGDVDSHALPEDMAGVKLRNKNLSPEAKKVAIKELTTSDRQREVYKFQEDGSCRMFIGSIEACKEGLTLTAATHVVFIDYPWNWASFDQALSRAHRIGQKNALTVHSFLCKGTVDEKVYNIIKGKKGMAEAILDNKAEPRRAFEFIQNMI